jgi:hypothetical protein
MKLRCTDHNIRIRVRKSDLTQLLHNGMVETAVGPGNFRFRLSLEPNADAMSASFADGALTVSLPEEVTRHWVDSDTVGMEQSWADGTQLMALIVEKDFPCSTTPEAELPDTFAELAKKSC